MPDAPVEFHFQDPAAISAVVPHAATPMAVVRTVEPLDAPPVGRLLIAASGDSGSEGLEGFGKDGKGSDGGSGSQGAPGASGLPGVDGKDGPQVELQVDAAAAVRVVESDVPLRPLDDRTGAGARVLVIAGGGAGGAGGRGGWGGSGGRGGNGGDGADLEGSQRVGRDGGDGGHGGDGGRGGNGGSGGKGGRGGRVTISAATPEALLAIAGVYVAGGAGGAPGLGGRGGSGGSGGSKGKGSKGVLRKDGLRERSGKDGEEGRCGIKGSDGTDGARGRDGPPGSLKVRIGKGSSAIQSDRTFCGVVEADIRGPSGVIAKVMSRSALEESLGTAASTAAGAVARLRAGSSIEVRCRLLLDGPAPFPVPIRLECSLDGCPGQEIGIVPPRSESADVLELRGRFTVPLEASAGRRSLVVRAVAVSSIAAWQVHCEAQVDVLPLARVYAVRVPEAVLACDDVVPVELLVESGPGECMGSAGCEVDRLRAEVRGTIVGSSGAGTDPVVVPLDLRGSTRFHAARVHVPLRTALDSPIAGDADPGLEVALPRSVELHAQIAWGDGSGEGRRCRVVLPLNLEAPLEVDHRSPAPVAGVPYVMHFRHRACSARWREAQAPGTPTEGEGISLGAPWPYSGDSPGNAQRRPIVGIEASASFAEGSPVIGKAALRDSTSRPVVVGFGSGLFAGKLSGTGQRPPVPVVELLLAYQGDPPGHRLACRYQVPLPQIALDVAEVVVRPGCPSGDVRVGIRLAPGPALPSEERIARGLAIRLVFPAGVLRDGSTSWTLPDPAPAVGPDGLVECRLPVSRPHPSFSMAVATLAGKAGVHCKRMVRLDRSTPSLDLVDGRLSERMWEPCELHLRFRRHADLAPDHDRSWITVRVRSADMALDGTKGEWVEARHVGAEGDEDRFLLGVAGDVEAGGAATLEVEVLEGGAASGRWQASVSRIPPPSNRLREAKYALLGGVFFAQKFKFAGVIMGIVGIAMTLAFKVPIGGFIGVAEAAILALMSDSFYLRRLQRPGRWW